MFCNKSVGALDVGHFKMTHIHFQHMGDFTLVLQPFIELLQLPVFFQSVATFLPCL